jgi:hypothetical protein
MPQFKTIEELLLHIKKDVDKVLKNEVATVVKQHITQEVTDTVYAAGIPNRYVRRGETFGFEESHSLGDPNEMEVYVENGVLEVEDNASPKTSWDYGSLAEGIEYGYGSEDQWYNEPRPFMENAEKALIQDKSHVKAMKTGLTNLGYKVK